MTRPIKTITTLGAAITMAMAGLAAAGELRPLDLPSAREPYIQQQEQQQQRAPDAAATVYDRFREKIGRLSKQEKNEALKEFKSRLETAKAAEYSKAAAHYQTLINILSHPESFITE